MQGTNAAAMKEHNRRLILNLIRQGKYSRTAIASATGLTKATVSGVCDELISNGIISETTHEILISAGRRPTFLALNENSRYVISFAMTRASYSAEVYNLGGKKVFSKLFSYEKTPQETILKMAQIIDEYSDKIKKESILGVGICCPGPVDYKTGKIINPPNFELWHNVELKNQLKEKCELPIFVENISNSLALYESYFGCCKLEKNYAYVVVDEGIGSGIIINGDIYRGALGYGNELGHITVEMNGKKCSCGNHGCLECYASVPSILSGTKYNSWNEVLEDNAADLIEKECQYLSAGMINLINLFDLNKIVLGGDIATNDFAKMLSDRIQSRIIVKHSVGISVSNSKEIRGAAAASMVFHNLLF